MLALIVESVFSYAQLRKDSKPRDWINYVRIAGHGLNKGNIGSTIQDAKETFIFGIEVDNDITGRYDIHAMITR